MLPQFQNNILMLAPWKKNMSKNPASFSTRHKQHYPGCCLQECWSHSWLRRRAQCLLETEKGQEAGKLKACSSRHVAIPALNVWPLNVLREKCEQKSSQGPGCGRRTRTGPSNRSWKVQSCSTQGLSPGQAWGRATWPGVRRGDVIQAFGNSSPHKRSVFGGISCTGIGEKPGSTPQCLGWPPSCTAGKQNWWTTKQLRKSEWEILCLQAVLAKKEHRCSSPPSLSLKSEILRSISTSCYIQKVKHRHIQALSYCQNSFMFRGLWAGAKSHAKSVHLLQRSRFYTSLLLIYPETQSKNRKVHLLPIPKRPG